MGEEIGKNVISFLNIPISCMLPPFKAKNISGNIQHNRFVLLEKCSQCSFFFWLHWVFVAVRRVSLVVASGGYSSLQCAGFSLQWLLLLRSMGPRACGVQ